MAGVRRIKPDVEAAILSEYASGVSAGKLGEKYGLHRKTITIVVRRNGGQVLDQRAASGRPPVDPSSYVDRVLELRDQGWSQLAIGRDVGMCQGTISRVLRQAGRPTRDILKRERHGSWRGGRALTGQGYIAVRVPEDWPYRSMISRSGYVLEHRKVMAEHFGRALTTRETVHHINGNAQDNRIENLQLRQDKHGKGVHMRCLDCGSTNVRHQKL